MRKKGGGTNYQVSETKGKHLRQGIFQDVKRLLTFSILDLGGGGTVLKWFGPSSFTKLHVLKCIIEKNF